MFNKQKSLIKKFKRIVNRKINTNTCKIKIKIKSNKLKLQTIKRINIII